MTLAAWKSRLQVGLKLRCSYRHYAPNTDELITIQKVQTNAIAYDYQNGSGSIKLRSGQLAWLYFSKKKDIRFTPDGFELLKKDSSLMSRYHWVE